MAYIPSITFLYSPYNESMSKNIPIMGTQSHKINVIY